MLSVQRETLFLQKLPIRCGGIGALLVKARWCLPAVDPQTVLSSSRSFSVR